MVATGLTEDAWVVEDTLPVVPLLYCMLELFAAVVRFLFPPFFVPLPPLRFSFLVVVGCAGLGPSSLWPTSSAQPTG